tara:strand:- start:2463 stop:3377 length:915 start_codon:yes stop_codon:yes gene_type:complete
MIAAREAVLELSRALGGGVKAELAASALIEAEVLGQPRFGIAMLDEWTKPAQRLPDIVDCKVVSWHDCSDCFSPVAVASATHDLSQLARKFGIAAVFLRGVKGFGRLAPFVRHLADAGLVGMMSAEGPPFVAPHGGNQPVIGTNPFAIALGQGADGVVIDIATSTATMAEIRKASTEGAQLAGGIAVDAAGKPTLEASQVAALLPRGGQIGSLVGLTVELLSGIVAGGRNDPQGRGVFILAIDPAAAAEQTDWEDKLVQLQKDWSASGGHWPRGGGLPPEAVLDQDFERRLRAHLSRMSSQGEC